MDKALKQRLVGASVLIILAVIILPMLLSGRSDTLKQESSQIELPAKPEEMSFETRRFPVGLPVREVQAAEQKTEDQVPATITPTADNGQPESASVLQANDEEQPDAKQGDDMAVEPASGDSASALYEREGVTSIILSNTTDTRTIDPDVVDETPRYLVQVASFSNEKRANALADRLRADKLPVVMDVVDRIAGRLHRVRVGPFAERSEANAVALTISKQSNDLKPRVLDLRPTDTAPVLIPSDPLVRWVVQVGSYSSESVADSEVRKLRLAGLSAFSEKVTSNDVASYKVRIGPEIDRAKAVELANKIKAEQYPDAFVTTHD